MRGNIYGFKRTAAASSLPENMSLNIFVHGINREVLTAPNPLLVDVKEL